MYVKIPISKITKMAIVKTEIRAAKVATNE